MSGEQWPGEHRELKPGECIVIDTFFEPFHERHGIIGGVPLAIRRHQEHDRLPLSHLLLQFFLILQQQKSGRDSTHDQVH